MSQSRTARGVDASLDSDKPGADAGYPASTRPSQAPSARDLGRQAVIDACARFDLPVEVNGAQAEAIALLLLSRRSSLVPAAAETR